MKMSNLRMNRLAATLVLCAAAAVSFTGCAGKRDLTTLQAEGERALSRGDYSRAEADFKEFIDRQPGNPTAHYLLGKTYLGMNRAGEAREQLEIAYSNNLRSDEVFDALCASLAADNEHDTMFQLLRARVTERNRPEDYLRLGKFSQQVGDMDSAQTAMLTAARLDGGRSAQYQLALSEFYSAIGDHPEAVRRARMAQWISPGNAATSRRLEALGEPTSSAGAIKPVERP